MQKFSLDEPHAEQFYNSQYANTLAHKYASTLAHK